MMPRKRNVTAYVVPGAPESVAVFTTGAAAAPHSEAFALGAVHGSSHLRPTSVAATSAQVPPSPTNPSLHVQVILPALSLHVAFAPQPPLPLAQPVAGASTATSGVAASAASAATAASGVVPASPRAMPASVVDSGLVVSSESPHAPAISTGEITRSRQRWAKTEKRALMRPV